MGKVKNSKKEKCTNHFCWQHSVTGCSLNYGSKAHSLLECPYYRRYFNLLNVISGKDRQHDA